MEYYIYVKKKNQALTYTLDQPLVTGNTQYSFRLYADTVADWLQAFSDENISNDNIMKTVTFWNTNLGEENRGSVTLGLSGEYYETNIPLEYLSARGSLQFVLSFVSNDQKVKFVTQALDYPPPVYAGGETKTTMSITDGSILSSIVSQLIGGEQDQILVKDSALNYDLRWDYAKAWGLYNDIELSLSGLAEGKVSTNFGLLEDDKGNTDIAVTKINFDAGSVVGKIPAECLPDSILGQMTYGGTIDGSTGVITWSDGAKSRLTALGSTIGNSNYTTTTTPPDNVEGMYFICSKSGTKPLTTVVGSNTTNTIESGDWLLANGGVWSRIDNTDAIRTVRGDNESAGRTGDIVLTANQIGAAKANISAGADSTKGYPAYRADQLTTARAINGVTFDGSANRTNYMVCSTASGTAAKVVATTSNNASQFVASTGSIAYVKFDNTNSASTGVTLKIGNTTAYPVYLGANQVGGSGASADTLRSGYVYPMVFVGDRYLLMTGVDSAPTQLSSERITLTFTPSSASGSNTLTNVDTKYVVAAGNLFVFKDGQLVNPSSYTIDTTNNKITFSSGVFTDTSIHTLDLVLYRSESVSVPTTLLGIQGLTDNTDEAAYNGGVKSAQQAIKLATARKIGNTTFDGTAGITLEAMGATTKALGLTLPASWSLSDGAYVQQITAEGVSTSNNLIVGPEPESLTNWNLYGVQCTAQGSNALAFAAKSLPEDSINIKVIIFP